MKGKNRPLYVNAFGQSDIGLVRKNNEDSFLLADLTTGTATFTTSALAHAVGGMGSLFVVADGMGGAEAGEVASRMAVELVFRRFQDQLRKRRFLNRQAFVKALKESIEYTNLAIYEESYNNEACRGMGTTLTAAGVYETAVFFAQVGDSRGYLIRNSTISQMTQDQSLVAQMVASGSLSPEEAKEHPQRNVILQALGAQKEVDVAITFADLKRGDWLLLCSDGLSGKVEGEELEQQLKKFPEPREACQRLVTIACERGAEDNITVIITRFDGEGWPPPSPGEVPIYEKFEETKGWRFWPW